MLKLTHKVGTGNATGTLTLPFESRNKSRLKATLDDGSQAGLFLPRGTLLRDGDLIASDDGHIIEIKAATETVSSVRSDDALLLARVCYHLGNRHVLLQIESSLVRYRHDHVLDDMVRGLGVNVTVEQASFEPEAGAYGDYGHAEGHAHHHH